MRGIIVAHLIGFMHSHLIKILNELTVNLFKLPYSSKLRELVCLDSSSQKGTEGRKIRLFILIPVLCIVFAEFLIFWGKIDAAILIDICILVFLSLSYILIKNLEIHRIYVALIFLPVLRLVSLSMPIFAQTPLEYFIFVYLPLIIPLGAIVMHQKGSFDEIGITKNNISAYVILSIPLGFLLGFGEYLVIHPGPLIPEFSFINLLKLTIIMIFFVGLVEELIFRSILQTRLQEVLSLQEALIITSILFGVMHSGYGTFLEILYTSVVGFIIGLSFYITRSLPFAVSIHGFANIFLFGILPYYLSG